MQLGKIGRLAAVVALASGVVAAPASAAILVATYTGKIQSGFDSSGVFGPHSSGLTGLAATMTFTFDTATPGADEQEVPPTYSGLSSVGSPAAGTATITIKGRSVPMVGTTQSTAQQLDNETFPTGDIDQVLHLVYAPDLGRGWDGRFTNYLRASVQGPDMVDQLSYLTPLEYDVTRADLTAGSFQFLQHYPHAPTIIDVWAYGTVYWNHVSISVAGLPSEPGAVPEPTSWALMIGGFGAVGVVLRRRQRRSGRHVATHTA
jgi:hypothetical protein